ncbi:Reverse transcriptase [Theobroma cacao]|nr:Reverse transcriptase [Theobroma cacao]
MAQLDSESDFGNCEWLLDSGNSQHIALSEAVFVDLDKNHRSRVRIENGGYLQAYGIGKVRIQSLTGHKYIYDVLFVPSFAQNILSVGQLLEDGYVLLFKDKTCRIYNPSVEEQSVSLIDLWHRRLGHYNYKTLEQVSNSSILDKLPKLSNNASICSVCQLDESIDDLPVRGTRSLEDIYQNSLVTIEEPSCYTEAYKDPIWFKAMQEELQMIQKNGTWSLVDRLENRNIIGVEWIFKKKLNLDGSLNRCKARLVAKGYSQLPGVNYGETFAPVARYDTIRLLLALAATLKWNVYHLYIKFAFLNGILEKEIYIEQLEGFELSSGENKSVVAQSLAESEYVAAAEAAYQALWLRKLLMDIKFEQKFPTDLFIDNKSAISIVKNPVWHGKTKHINVKYHAVRDIVEKNEINVQYCPSELQLADIFTKPFQKSGFESFRTQLNLSIASVKGEC